MAEALTGATSRVMVASRPKVSFLPDPRSRSAQHPCAMKTPMVLPRFWRNILPSSWVPLKATRCQTQWPQYLVFMISFRQVRMSYTHTERRLCPACQHHGSCRRLLTDHCLRPEERWPLLLQWHYSWLLVLRISTLLFTGGVSHHRGKDHCYFRTSASFCARFIISLFVVVFIFYESSLIECYAI
jgi:hypothetical protein